MAHRDLPNFNHVDLLFPGDYLKAGDLRGRDVTVTIEDIEPRHELLGKNGKKKKKPLMLFVGKDKGLVLNTTNGQTIASLHGSEVTGWIGKRITLYARVVDAFGRRKEAVRVREQVPASPRTQQRDQPPPIPHEARVDAAGPPDHDFGPGEWGSDENRQASSPAREDAAGSTQSAPPTRGAPDTEKKPTRASEPAPDPIPDAIETDKGKEQLPPAELPVGAGPPADPKDGQGELGGRGF